MGKKVQSNYYFDSFPELAHFSVECGEHILDFMKSNEYNYIINTTEGRKAIEDSKTLRRGALQYKVTYTTTINAAFASCMANDTKVDETASVHSIQELHNIVHANLNIKK